MPIKPGDDCDYNDLVALVTDVEPTSLIDSDGDGIPDTTDNCPTVCNREQLDADGDKIGDVCDTDPSCGGCSGIQCEQPCPASSTTTSILPTTSSTSSTTTSIMPTTSSTTTTSIPDTDGDGIPDNVDNCPTNCNSQQLDADGDKIGDVCDTDPGCGGCSGIQCEQQC